MTCDVCSKGREYMMGYITNTVNGRVCTVCGKERKIFHHTNEGIKIEPPVIAEREDKNSEWKISRSKI